MSPTPMKYTDEPSANLVARVIEVAEQQERRSGTAGLSRFYVDASEFYRDALALREIARRVIACESELRASREREAALQALIDADAQRLNAALERLKKKLSVSSSGEETRNG